MKPNGHVNITVRGTDMFGASFRESAQLIAVADSELSLSMWRPVAENAEVEIRFYEDERCWMQGVIMKVRIRLDGIQTVNVKMHAAH
jgi:hypothetical protein